MRMDEGNPVASANVCAYHGACRGAPRPRKNERGQVRVIPPDTSGVQLRRVSNRRPDKATGILRLRAQGVPLRGYPYARQALAPPVVNKT
jgi:hypothetical protein